MCGAHKHNHTAWLGTSPEPSRNNNTNNNNKNALGMSVCLFETGLFTGVALAYYYVRSKQINMIEPLV